MMTWPSKQSPIARSDNACMHKSSRHNVLQCLHVLVGLIICVQFTLPVFANAITDLDISSPCTKTYTSDTGQVCSFCSAGYYKTDDCVDSLEQARCRPCPPGTYQSMCNVATSCATCSTYCKNRHHVIERACTPTSDILCRCDDGFYWFYESSDPADGLCLKHSLCPRGSGLKATGTYYNDTVCAPCRPGATFSSSASLEACEPCTVCEHYNATCTATSDSKCGAKLPEIPRDTSGAHGSGEGMNPAILMVIILGSFVAFGFVVFVIIQFVRRRLGNSKPTSQPSTFPGEDATAESIDTAPQTEASQEPTSVNGPVLPHRRVTEECSLVSNATSRQEDIDEIDASPTGPTLVLDDEEGERTHEMSRVETPTGTVPIDREDRQLYSAQMFEGCYRQQNFDDMAIGSDLHYTMEITAPKLNPNPKSDPSLFRRTRSVQDMALANVQDETNVKTRNHGNAFGVMGMVTDLWEAASIGTGTSSFALQNQPEVQTLRTQHFNFLADMSPKDFYPFFRNIAKHKQVDSWIDAAKQENHSVKETQYQLMRRFHEVFPYTSHSDIVAALHDVNLNGCAKEYSETFVQRMAVYV